MSEYYLRPNRHMEEPDLALIESGKIKAPWVDAYLAAKEQYEIDMDLRYRISIAQAERALAHSKLQYAKFRGAEIPKFQKMYNTKIKNEEKLEAQSVNKHPITYDYTKKIPILPAPLPKGYRFVYTGPVTAAQKAAAAFLPPPVFVERK